VRIRPFIRGVALATALLALLSPLALARDSSGSSPAGVVGSLSAIPAAPTIGPGWDGIDYFGAARCASCALPDLAAASGNGYVVELAGSQVREWTTSGALVLNLSLTMFAGVPGTDRLTQPQVVYDNATQRWVISFLDQTSGAIYYGASLSSDPSVSGAMYWSFQQFGAPRRGNFDQPRLAVDTNSVVIVANIWNGGSVAGFEAFAASKAQLIRGTPPQTCTSGQTGSSSDASYVPASDLSASNTTYLVSVDAGGTTTFNLRTLTGTPTACTVSAPTSLATRTTTPPNASQPNSTDLIQTSGNLTSATWRGGTLWAAATDGCLPSGDSGLRSCLHLWKINTAGDSLEQDFTWSRGAGYYEYDPALATDADGDVAVVYGESSALNSEYPSVHVTIQSPADLPGSLEAPQLLRAGSGPAAPASGCVGSPAVCPFGLWFGAAVSPLSPSTFWVAGEYTSSTSSTDFWRTWVNELTSTGGSTWLAGSVTPQNATLRIDNVAISLVAGSFNVTVAAGTHLVQAVLAGYEPFAADVTVGAGQGIRMTVVLIQESPPPSQAQGLYLPIPLWLVAVLLAAAIALTLIVARVRRRRKEAPRPWPKPQGASGTAEIGSAIAAALDRRAASEREERERRQGGQQP
jgi:hypothetical protein